MDDIIVVVRNSGGRWHSWFGERDGSRALFNTGGHATEEEARAAVEEPVAIKAELEKLRDRVCDLVNSEANHIKASQRSFTVDAIELAMERLVNSY
jgi:hypothetical protein